MRESQIPRDQIVSGTAENDRSLYPQSSDFQRGTEKPEKFDAAQLDRELSVNYLDLAEGMSDSEMDGLVNKAKAFLDQQNGSKEQIREALAALSRHEEKKAVGRRTDFLRKLSAKYLN